MDIESSDGWAAVYENHIADMYAVREHAQLELTSCLENADLFGASMASFQHAIASAELGDGREAQVHLFLAAVLAEADVQLIADQVDEQLEEIEIQEKPTTTVFSVPNFVNYEIDDCIIPEKNWRRYRHVTEMVQPEYAEAERARKEALPAIEAAEVAVNIESLPAEDVNEAIQQAVEATVKLVFVRSMSDRERQKLLHLACTIASKMDYSGDYESTAAAFSIYEQIALGAIATPGKTMSALTRSLQVMKEINAGSFEPIFGEDARKYIDMLTKARNFKMAFNSTLPILGFWDAFRPHMEGSNDWWTTPSRTSRRMQRTARSMHAEKSVDENLIEQANAA